MARKTVVKILGADAIRVLALAAYRAGTSLPDAIREIDAKANRPTIGIVSPVYWDALGADAPIRVRGNARKADGTISANLARAIRKRRDAGVRWEVLAASVRAGTGVPFSPADAKAAYVLAGGDLAGTYTGRGTRRAAPKTYAAPARPTPAATDAPSDPYANLSAEERAVLAAYAKAKRAKQETPAKAKRTPSAKARTRAGRKANADALRAEGAKQETPEDANAKA